jgi:hypothetical protein
MVTVDYGVVMGRGELLCFRGVQQVGERVMLLVTRQCTEK